MLTLGHSYPTTPENPSFGKTQGVNKRDIIASKRQRDDWKLNEARTRAGRTLALKGR